MFKKILSLVFLSVSCFLLNRTDCFAEELTTNITTTPEKDSTSLSDNNHLTYITLNKDDNITVSSNDGQSITSVYIVWNSPVDTTYTITTDSGAITCGTNGFIHDYIKLDAPTSKLTVNIPKDNMNISDIRIFSEGELPNDVQIWKPSCDKADFLVISSHADDEILFFGGVLPIYSTKYDAAVQVLYMAEFWSTEPEREHEKLNGLYEAGIRYYPACANFKDIYTPTYEYACNRYNYDDMHKALVTFIRQFKPQVIVTHDTKGEYGHGFHILTCEALMAAVESANDNSFVTDNLTTHGIYNTPKTYIHLYPENKIKIDMRYPMDEFGGRTALEVCKDAYKKHVSQQKWDFYVSDDYAYSCADYGLWRTTVGYDTENNMLENLKTYKVQAEEAEKLRQEEESRKEEERLKQEEESRKEAESISIAQKESISKAEAESMSKKEEALLIERENNRRTTLIIIAIIVILTIPVFIFTKLKKNKEKFSDKSEK